MYKLVGSTYVYMHLTKMFSTEQHNFLVEMRAERHHIFAWVELSYAFSWVIHRRL
jgi:hypothetical protein